MNWDLQLKSNQIILILLSLQIFSTHALLKISVSNLIISHLYNYVNILFPDMSVHEATL